jgi:hypothetical protein
MRRSQGSSSSAEGLWSFYGAAPPLRPQTLTYTAGVIRCHRRQIGSLWRKLGLGQQALLTLAYLRKGETFAELAAGSALAPPPPGSMRGRPWPCWSPGPRSSARPCAGRRRQVSLAILGR